MSAPPAGNLLSRNLRASTYLYSAALLIFMRRTTPALPTDPMEPIEPAPPLSSPIKGQHVPGAAPEP